MYYGSPITLFIYAFDNLFFSFALTAVLAILQLALEKKLKISPIEKLLPFLLLSLGFGIAGFINQDFILAFVYSLDFLLARSVLLLSDLPKKIKTKWIAILTAFVLSIGAIPLYSLFGRMPLHEALSIELPHSGSWGSINQSVKRGENWKQIVKDKSLFQLGELLPEEDWGDKSPVYDIGSYPSLDGSTVCVPLAAEIARQFLGIKDEEVQDAVYFSTTHLAYEKLFNHYEIGFSCPWLGEAASVSAPMDVFLGTEPSTEELEMAKSAGVELIQKPFCYDAFVFITNKENPVDSLTIEEIQSIYTGEIKNWKELGGKSSRIKPFQREANSGSQTAMENLVMKDKKMLDPKYIPEAVGMGMLVDTVAEYDNSASALGYTYRYYIDNLYKNENIKVLAVNGVYPSDENIRSGAYPFTTNYYGVILKGTENQKAGKFLDWLQSEEGQRVVAEAGYIPLQKIAP